MLKAKDLRGESPEQLEAMLNDRKREMFDLRSQRLDSKTQQTHLIGQKRKDVARILTVLREKQS